MYQQDLQRVSAIITKTIVQDNISVHTAETELSLSQIYITKFYWMTSVSEVESWN
jgi:hypothetical protein